MQTLSNLLSQEHQQFLDSHARSMALSQRSKSHFLYGAPLHWMSDWSTPHLVHIAQANGHRLLDVDGNSYIDLCLGDTGAMFGHHPSAVHAVLQDSHTPFTTMLPSAQLDALGDALQHRFNLPFWQITLSASDANRFLIRWVRAITRRSKILVFDGCYHGAVDDTLVDWSPQTGVTPRASLLGEVYSHAEQTVVVPFNDVSAVASALASRDVACVLAEPALTNCGLVLPDPDFWSQVQALCQSIGTRLIFDETHTLSTGLGGYRLQHGIDVDAVVMGKAIAGGWPCGVYGFSEQMAQEMLDAKSQAASGHSGIGTTLSGGAMTIQALLASLENLHQPSSYRAMLNAAHTLHIGLQQILQKHQRLWQVTQLGARMEIQFCRTAPRNAQDARDAQHESLEQYIHLFMLNRGVLLTPFHNMMLCAPSLGASDIDQVLQHWDHCLTVLKDVDLNN